MTAPSAPDTVLANTLSAQAQSAQSGTPVLTIASPTFRHDPKALFDALAREAADLPVELVVVDDGSGDPALSASLKAQIEAFPAPARLILLGANVGRSKARNRLIAEAHGRYLLFLDSDMLPDAPDFLAQWYHLASTSSPDVAYGGYSVKQVPDVPELALARALATRMDCQDAAARSMRGVMAVATSNLLVRADVLTDIPFDSGFAGWGWEDAEWAVRAHARFGVIHVDIPATHLGLDRADVILAKFAEAGPNFAVAAARHPQMLATPGNRIAVGLSRLPGWVLVGLILSVRMIALWSAVPVRLRATAARMFRAAHAARGLQSQAQAAAESKSL
jgi:glycosyltransferase involved in cell wall biosynthesis